MKLIHLFALNSFSADERPSFLRLAILNATDNIRIIVFTVHRLTNDDSQSNYCG